jgi:uncharacterized protein YdeI (YjbR/CyaY-like superfamily)
MNAAVGEPSSSSNGLSCSILEFETSAELCAWLKDPYDSAKGIWLRIYKKNSGICSVTFEQVLDEGLCFGWSESKRRKYDAVSYLQKFTPRKSVGSQSARYLARAQLLVEQGKMTPAGLAALDRK